MGAVFCFHFPFYKKYDILVKRKVITLKYTDLIFDLYGTLVDTHTEEGIDTWERTAIYYGFYGANYTGKELMEAFDRSVRQREAAAKTAADHLPDLPCEESFAQLFRDKGVTKNADSLGFQAAQVFRMISMEYLKLYPGVKEALTQLRKAGYRLWLLSNAQAVFTAYEIRHLGLESYFDGIYLSSDHGCRKPDSRFFHKLLKEQDLDSSKCLMIGNDRRSDIAGGTAAGVDTFFLQTNQTPASQASANARLHPAYATAETHHYEMASMDWNEIAPLLLQIST